jgi:CubicO group peptidase (beta-lactamase class C family)
MAKADLLRHIDALAQRALDEAEAPGMALGVSTRDGERIIRTYGFANRDAQIPVDQATLFEIGSISKHFLSVVFMQLAAEGRIDLHAPVTDYLPWFSVRSAHAPITAHHLLCHTAGLPGGFAHRPDRELAETVLGRSFDQLMRERVLEPLGLADSSASVTSSKRPALAVGYKRQFDGRPWRSGAPVYPATWLETSSGAGSIVMTASDLLAWAEFLLRTWNGVDSPVLTSVQLRAMVGPDRLPAPAVEEAYGYGLYWRTGNTGEIIFLGHGGDMVGYESGMGIDLADGTCVVWLANGMVPDYSFRDDMSQLVANARVGQPLADLPDETLRSFRGAEDWTGVWHSRDRSIEIALAGDGLAMHCGDQRIPLQRYSRRSNSYLTVDAPGWDRFLFEAVRETNEDEAPGAIVTLHYAFETFVRAGEPLPEPPAYPAEWNGYVGFYRSYNPWYPAIWIVIRDGALALIDSYGSTSAFFTA